MRHRRVVNLYDEDPLHLELILHLEGIEGRTRQSMELAQMALIGFRVMARQEGGEEAFIRARNPDLRRLEDLRGKVKPKSAREVGPGRPPEAPPRPSTAKAVAQPQKVETGPGKGWERPSQASITPMEQASVIEGRIFEVNEPVVPENTVTLSEGSLFGPEEEQHVDDYDESNTLAWLRQQSGD
ncbi:hypothetical protein HNP46_000140 [Pseudomonas nitritireducens]|uniref:Uncharacterized protein n=1 Tax=Pseudomonas nitroreducens TaxID=46680 RepID=A0A7W7KEG1_PSENT|nr:hypothetical protein [Pseudomonas nitritireducens]MBB4861329.1 hypothetical protein [Pseudomonas nitritireducens]